MSADQHLGRRALDGLRSGAAVLAPMSGVTDVCFRRLAERFGASLVVSEMVASRAFAHGAAEASLRAQGADIAVHAVQLAGCEAYWLGEAARVAAAHGAALIDINMGCPAKSVTGGLAGSALMRDLDHALRLIDAVVAAVTVPVTLKMRLGWDDQSRNAPELARRAEAAGVGLVTVHGRTRQQFYKGAADWDAVAAVRAATALPLVVNGDIVDGASAAAARAASGADAVMVGRAALGRPWLVGEIAAAQAGRAWQPPTPAQKTQAVCEHYEAILDLYGRDTGVRHARKHLSAYAAHARAPERLRQALVASADPAEVLRLVQQLFDRTQLELAA
ncbi:tRNA dihydrouridine synthase DusB [Chelatococcus reniformis]|uniref:tRNA-dihydrouridine synthase n=1 Tax=Chelatococcus reniformis TaxID=1494448 RepID=A0A916U0L1_9HYPH|nr:tRNA dihydrouridine synthase DusB [Chelatococcus reniformis]GGC55753.1 tRNA-dihydrouridine synthase [Chelatococcus reniformis]